MTDLAERTEDRDEGQRGLPAPPVPDGMSGLHLRVAVLPAAAVAVLGIATVAFALRSGRPATTTRIVLIAAAALTALVLIAAVSGAAAATRRLQRQVADLQSSSLRAQDELRRLTEQAAPVGADQRVEVFVNLARRMQSLVHREIQLLDELESQVEDPDLLTGLFTVDHLATRLRRQSESLAVLGGAVARRQWSRPVTVHEVLRAAVAEVEHYPRVTVVPPVEGTLAGSAVTDVIHLVAELIENATKFSAPHTQAMLRAESGPAGLVIEVEDRGLGMLAADQQRMNELLADPGQVNLGELLRDGRIGLFVVATLARRHGIQVALRSNSHGGLLAAVVLPATLIEATPPADEPPDSAPEPRGFQQRGFQQREPQQREAQRRGSRHRRAVPPEEQTGPAGPAAPVPPAAPAKPPALAKRAAPAKRAVPPKRAAPAKPAATPAAHEDAAPPGGTAPETAAPVDTEPASNPPAPSAPSVPSPPAAERPKLPRRAGQTHMAPELQEARTQRGDDPVDDQLPGLMAAFQRGVSQAAEEEEDSPARTDSTR